MSDRSHRWSPAFHLVPNGAPQSPPYPSGGGLVTIDTFTPAPSDGERGSTLAIGNHVYLIYPARTGSTYGLVGRSISKAATVNSSGQAVRIRLKCGKEVGALHVWHAGPAPMPFGDYWYQGCCLAQPDGSGVTEYIDTGGLGISGVAVPAVDTWNTEQVIPLSSFTYAGVSRGANMFHMASVDSLVYEDECDDPERKLASKIIRRRERGVRARVGLRIRYPAGSDSEKIVALIYGARLAWPTVETYFTLNYDAANPTWRKVVISGDFDATPKKGSTYMEQLWNVTTLETIRSVPACYPEQTGRQPW